MKSKICHKKPMELKAVDQHLMNGCGENAWCLFLQCKKCGKIEIIKCNDYPE